MVYAAMAVYTLIKARRQLQFRLLSMLLFSFALWSLSAAVIYYPGAGRFESEVALHTLSLSISAYGILIFLNLVLFSGYLRHRKWVFFLSALFFLLQSYLQLTGNLLILEKPTNAYNLNLFKYKESPYLSIIEIVHNLLVISGFILLFLSFRKTKSKLKRRQSAIILFAGISTYVLASLNAYAVRYLSNGEAPVFTDFWLLIFAAALYYAMIRLELFEITPGDLSNRLIDILPAGFILTDSKNRIVRYNAIAQKLFGCSGNCLQNLSLQKLIDERVEAEDLGKTDVFSSGSIRIIDSSGQIKHAYWYIKPVDKKHRNELGRIIIITDIEALHKTQKELERLNDSLETQVLERTSDLAQAKEKAEESDKLKTAFLQNLSHEIRTPLNAVVGFSSLLPACAGESKEIQSYTELIQKSSRRLLVVVENILAISSLQSGNEKVHKSKTNLQALMTELYQSFSYEARLKQIELITKQPPDHTLNSIFITDGIKLRKIFEHLIDNAIKFTSSGFVEFGYEIQDAYYRFFVKDTGCGIKPENQKVIFERFRQCADEGKLNSGNGLGLTIADAYVNLLEANLELNSSKSKGSEFYFYLPVHEPADKDDWLQK
jgi:PAS domain S-box-containing protein